MTRLPDPLRSRAVLIGVGNYQNLSSLPAVRNNLMALDAALRADRVWGLPSGNCTIVEDPATTEDMLDPVVEAAQKATDTVLLYYAGHGLLDPRRGELHLTRPKSDPQRMHTSVPYGQIRDALLDSPAARRIVILDCCYSGRALGQMADPVSAVVDEASAEGTYVLAATQENKTALAPPGERYTAFTGELLAIVDNGIEGLGPLLDLDSIYQHLRTAMAGKGRPLPQKRDRNTAGMLTMIRNNAFRQDRRHGLVIVDGDYLFRELRTGLTGAAKRDLRPGLFHNALYEILVFLAERGRVVVYATETAIPERMATLDSARRAGATVTDLTRDGPATKPANIAMAMAAADALPTIKELILVTGDGALVAVVERARSAGVVTTFARFPGTPNHALSIAADHIVDLPTPGAWAAVSLPKPAGTSAAGNFPKTPGPWVLAVDFGSANTVAAVADARGVESLYVDGRLVTPSAVFLHPDSKTWSVGETAVRIARGRLEWFEPYPRRSVPDGTLFLGGEAIPVGEPIAALLHPIAEEALRQHGGRPPSKYLVTHPASWRGSHVAILLEAAAVAAGRDWPAPWALSEPVAAAQRIMSIESVPKQARLAVLDLGAGTVAVTVVDRDGSELSVIGRPIERDGMGGEDYNLRLARWMVAEAGAPGLYDRLATSDDPDNRERAVEIRLCAREVREELSRRLVVPAQLPESPPELPKPSPLTVSRPQLEALIVGGRGHEPGLADAVDIVAAALNQASPGPPFAGVLLTGECAQIPILDSLVQERTGRRPFTYGDPATLVVHGAAVVGWNSLDHATVN